MLDFAIFALLDIIKYFPFFLQKICKNKLVLLNFTVKEVKMEQITVGQRIGKRIVLKWVYDKKRKMNGFICKCECGLESFIQGSLLKKGRSKSCIHCIARPETSKKEFDIKELYAKLEHDKATMVDYFYGTQTIYVFTIAQNKLAVKTIKNSDTTTPKIVQFIELFSNATTISNNPTQYNYYANIAYETLQLPKTHPTKTS